MEPIRVRTPSGDYAVLCERGALARLGAFVAPLGGTGAFILSSPRVWTRWGKQVERSFDERGARVILFDDRESAKTLRTVEKLCRALVRAGADRGAILVAVGGGVVGDVVGFVGACHLRGLGVVQAPTTLLAQVDSAIGGKTGVDLPEGKNLVGAFHQPRLVVADPEALHSLPERQYRAGLYEVVKYGVIGDEELFAFLERRLDELSRQEPAALDFVLPRCMRAKAAVVAQDEREAGPREVLNFGHTVGHALEAATRYRRFLHGEAVAWGMLAAARLATEMKLLDPSAAFRIGALIHRVGPLPAWPRIAPQRLLRAMRVDKKARGGRLRFVLPRRVGSVEAGVEVPEELLLRVLISLDRLATQ